jgi:hypothetical protein
VEKAKMADESKKTLEHGGQQYELDKISELVEAGMKDKQAVWQLYPTVPKASMTSLLAKVRKHPYYIARKDVNIAIIREKGPELQQNLIDIALEGRSERNRLEATIDALDRVYGKAEDENEKPLMVFNFSFDNSGNASKNKQHTEVIDGETFDN